MSYFMFSYTTGFSCDNTVYLVWLHESQYNNYRHQFWENTYIKCSLFIAILCKKPMKFDINEDHVLIALIALHRHNISVKYQGFNLSTSHLLLKNMNEYWLNTWNWLKKRLIWVYTNVSVCVWIHTCLNKPIFESTLLCTSVRLYENE